MARAHARHVIRQALPPEALVFVEKDRVVIDGLGPFCIHCLPKKTVARDVRQLAANRRWVRRKDFIVDVLQFFRVPMERQCPIANKVATRVFGPVPPLPKGVPYIPPRPHRP